MKSICHIITTLNNGGAENVLTNLANAFEKRNSRQWIVITKGNENDFLINQIHPNITILFLEKDFLEIKKLFLENPNLKIICWMYSSIIKAYQLKAKWKFKNTLIWNIRHSTFAPLQLYQKSSLYVFGIISQLMKPKIVYCAHKAKRVHEKYFFKKEQSKVIQNRLVKGTPDFEFNYDKNQKTLLFVGRFHKHKGPKRLLRIVERFLSHNKEYKLLIAGSGWSRDILPKSIENKITLLGNVENIYEIYSQASIFLLTSYVEGYPNVLTEAIISGLSVVSFDVGDANSILENYPFGSVVQSEKEFLKELVNHSQNNYSELKIKEECEKQQKRLNFELTVDEYNKFLFD